MKFQIHVHLKPEVLDAQGREIQNSLARIGYDQVDQIQVGKSFTLNIKDCKDEATGIEYASTIAKKVLANPSAETFAVRRVED